MRHAARLFYPVLFAAALVLGVAARGAGQYRDADLALVLAVTVLLTALALAAALLVGRAVGRPDLVAAAAMLAVAWLFFYVPARNAAASVTRRHARGLSPLAADRVLMPLGALATLGVLVWLARQPRERLAGVSAFMTRFGLLLVAIVAVRTVAGRTLRASDGRALPRVPSRAERSSLAREMAQPVRALGAPPPGRNTPPRDIYLIVLDGHVNSRVLREVFHTDNSRFEDSLRALGFVLPPGMHSNYSETTLSLPSLLNSAHMTRSVDYKLSRLLIENNRAARFLKSHGYKYVLFPSVWWGHTQHSPLADVEFDGRPGFNLLELAGSTELRLAVLRSTLLYRWSKYDHYDADFHFRTFQGLEKVRGDAAPTFTFAHVMLPHIPYYLDEHCRRVKRPITEEQEEDPLQANTPEVRAAYVAQLRCVDGLTLDLVTKLLRRSPTPPIILVVGDHGTRFSDIEYRRRSDRVSTELVRERFGAFGAFYLPAGGDSAFHERVALVNVVGNVLRYYFDADLPPGQDEIYLSGVPISNLVRIDPARYFAERFSGQ